MIKPPVPVGMSSGTISDLHRARSGAQTAAANPGRGRKFGRRVTRVTRGCVGLPGVAWGCLGLPGVAWGYLGLPGVAWGCLVLPGVAWGYLGLPPPPPSLPGLKRSCIGEGGLTFHPQISGFVRTLLSTNQRLAFRKVEEVQSGPRTTV